MLENALQGSHTKTYTKINCENKLLLTKVIRKIIYTKYYEIKFIQNQSKFSHEFKNEIRNKMCVWNKVFTNKMYTSCYR